jgi:hypothetical protein
LLAGRRDALGVEEAAHVERVAGAAARRQQPVAHRVRAGDQRVDLGQLAVGEVAQLGVRGAVGVGVQQRARLLEREPGLLFPLPAP